MSEEITIWKHQEKEDAPIIWEKNDGEIVVIDEANCDISQMYARLLASGQMANTVVHAAARSGVGKDMAYAMIEDMSMKCPQYMDLGESHRVMKRIAKKLKEKQQIAESEETEKLKKVNELANNMAESQGYKTGGDE